MGDRYKRGQAQLGQDSWLRDGKKVVVLPHQCDAWVIGGREEVEMLVADLVFLLESEDI